VPVAADFGTVVAGLEVSGPVWAMQIDPKPADVRRAAPGSNTGKPFPDLDLRAYT
jgi:hypothetical protein